LSDGSSLSCGRQLLDAAGRMRETARRVAEIDMLGCFAHLAALRGWVRPQVEESGVLEFVQARHPVVERRLEESGAGGLCRTRCISMRMQGRRCC
jgi:DNA mismatch repair protein MutS